MCENQFLVGSILLCVCALTKVSVRFGDPFLAGEGGRSTGFARHTPKEVQKASKDELLC